MFKGKVYILFDGQAGSCGKGKFVGLFARRFPIDISINNNPPNAGHTFVFDNGECVITTHLPIAVVSPYVKFLIIGAGAIINPETLVDEIIHYKNLIGDRKIYIHKNAAIVLPKHKETELEKIRSGSTFKGTAAALSDKIMRNSDTILAGNYDWISEFETALSKNENKIKMVQTETNKTLLNKNVVPKQKLNINKLKNTFQIIDDNFIESVLSATDNFTGKENILIETSQGFDLDINHGLEYPYVTSRQCSPAQALADCGLPHNIKTQTYMIFRPYPIRISNNTEIGKIYSGGYDGTPEINWKDVEKESLCSNIEKSEITTVTKQLRRVFEFNKKRFRRAILLTNPDYLILNFAQYINYNVADINNKKFKAINKIWYNRKFCSEMNDELYASLAEKHYGINLVNLFCDEIEEEFGKKVLFVGTGKKESCFIDRSQQRIAEKYSFRDDFIPGL